VPILWIPVELTVISTFAGCGGSSLGYKWAGFKELLAIEWDSHAVECFKLNFDCPVWERDIKEVSGKEILEFCNIEKGELDILDGSPPCQGFSIAGKRQVNDLRNDLFKEYKRLVNELQPKIFVMENVTGMAKGKMKGLFLEILKELKELNYNVKCKKMNSKYYGVPQSRERLIFIGIRKDLGIEPYFPKPINKIIIVEKLFKKLKNNIIEKESKISSENINNIYDRLKPGEGCDKFNKASYFNTRKIYKNKPSQTLIKTKNLLHFNEKRYLTIKEAKAICSFPDDFKLMGSYHEQWARLGNSVMPKFMQAIATTLKKEILIPYYKNNIKEF